MTVYEVVSQSGNRRRKYWADINHGAPVRVKITPKILADIFARATVDPDSGCWIWAGAKDQKGYAQKSLNGKAHRLSRVMVQTFIRSLKHQEQANHNDECRNPKCINPAHLSPLTLKENTADGNRARRTKRMARMLVQLIDKLPDDKFTDKVRRYLSRIPEGRGT